MGRMRNLLLPETLEQVALDLRQFVADEERTTYSLPPMDKETRKKVHMLAEAFGLVSKSRGSGHQRFM
jgi:predicted RNA-binding protein Jag